MDGVLFHQEALERHSQSPEQFDEIRRCWKSIMRRRDEMSVSLRGALEACARAGIEMFWFPELRRTFCPNKDEYFEPDAISKPDIPTLRSHVKAPT